VNFLLLISKSKTNTWRWVLVRDKPIQHSYNGRNWNQVVVGVGVQAACPETVYSPKNYYVDANDYFVIETHSNAAR